jgi:MFS transporter, ACS family, hexuronate transporter
MCHKIILDNVSNRLRKLHYFRYLNNLSPNIVEKSVTLNAQIGKYRWRICTLVFFATTINYLDRQVISLLKDGYLQPLFNWSESDYADIVVVFQVSYALGMLGAGWVIDKIGTKLGYAVALTVWSIAAVLHAVATGNFSFAAVRALLGVSEAGNFPAAIKTTAEWFPKKERAFATGIFNSGANVGAIVAPLSVPLIAEFLGWQWAFIITGAIGFVWLIFWFAIYEAPGQHQKLTALELDYIRSDADEVEQPASNEKVSWLNLLTFRQSWAFILGKFLTDPVWWFYLFWLPSFLTKEYGMKGTEVSFPVAVVYCMSTFGSIFGGWLSGNLMQRGWPAYKARKRAMLLFALTVLPVISAQALGSINPWFAIGIIGVATAAHQAWSANIFTTASDMFPRKAVASIVGIGGMAGAFGGVILSKSAGKLLDHFNALGRIEAGYYIMFIICGSAYLLAWLVMHFLVPRMDRVKLD